jgi:hypothetical protein
MTYSESAEGVLITFERALEELAAHGVLEPQNIAEFLQELGLCASYDAGDVMRFLGY